MKLPEVRLAGPGDEENLFSLLMDFNKENNTFGFEIEADRIMEHIKEATEHRGGICGIVDADHEIAAATNIVWNRSFFTTRYHLEETFFYVRPTYRKYRIADALMDWTKSVRRIIEEAEGHPVILLTSVTSENRLAAKARWWRRHCGKEAGLIYFLR